MMIPYTHNASFSEIRARKKAQFFTVVLNPEGFGAFSEISPTIMIEAKKLNQDIR
jgi:hypothetical protein